MTSFAETYDQLLRDFGPGQPMVLSTTDGERVSSRMMSVVLLSGRFLLQTDRAFRKVDQMRRHPHVALCAGNLQVEGRCEELGAPLAHPDFCAAYAACFPDSFRRYSALPGEVLFAVTPTRMERWRYESGVPLLEVWDILERRYTRHAYGA